jgi:hypothetical protein
MLQRESSRPSSRKQSPQAITINNSSMHPRPERLYSIEEVREWCDKLMEAKFKYLSLEIA